MPAKTLPAKTLPLKTWRRKARGSAAYAAAGVLITGLGFGIFAVAGGLSSAGASAAIPSPPRANATFTEDDDGTGADNQQNILESTAPGLVHIVSAHGASVGVGVILTPSGIVLTGSQVLRSAGAVTVRRVLDGKAYATRLLGSDATTGLALLQVEGGPQLRPVAVGNSRDFAVGDTVTAVGSSGTARTFTLDLGSLARRNATADIGGRKLAGLLATTLQVPPAGATGGPLVNLSGQVLGITLAGTGSGLHSVGFAVPINQALAVARQIDGRS